MESTGIAELTDQAEVIGHMHTMKIWIEKRSTFEKYYMYTLIKSNLARRGQLRENVLKSKTRAFRGWVW
jgi:hypothetical protein